MEFWDWLENLKESAQVFIVKETIFNIRLYKGVDEFGCFTEGLSKECKEFFLIFSTCGLKPDFVTNTIEKSQSEKLIEWWLTVGLDLVDDFFKKDFVNLHVNFVIGFLAVENIHNALFVHLFNV